MDWRILDLLPDAGRQLVAEIEAFSGLPVDTVEDPRRVRESCYVTNEKATILVPSLSAIDPDGILHEVLHIHRNWPGRVPLILPTNRGSQTLVDLYGKFDNQLEHLVIVPWQAKLGRSVTNRWADRLKKEWSSRFWESIPHAQDRRANLLLSYLSVRLIVADIGLTQLAQGELQELGLLDPAEEYLQSASAALGNKPRLAGVTFKHLGLPPDECRLVTLDVRHRREVEAVIPVV